MKNKTTLIRLVVVIGLLGAVVAFFGLGLQHQFSLDALKARRDALDSYHQAHPVALATGFFLVYIAVAALSLPAAAPLTLAGGTLFGVLAGAVLVSFASTAQFRAWARPDQMAILINAYNAFTIQLVLTRRPRLAPIKDIGSLLSSPWNQDFFTLLGRRTNLDHVESLLRTTRGYDDPRIHFALNCASVDCPMLRNEACVGDRLHSQLDDATRRFLGDRKRNRYDPNRDALQVSKIFDWYANDFRVGSYRSVAALLSAHAAQLSNDPKIQARIRAQSIDIAFLPYDWHLNAVGTP